MSSHDSSKKTSAIGEEIKENLKQSVKNMDIKDFKLYGEQINQIRYAYSENFSEYRTTSSDMEYWLS